MKVNKYLGSSNDFAYSNFQWKCEFCGHIDNDNGFKTPNDRLLYLYTIPHKECSKCNKSTISEKGEEKLNYLKYLEPINILQHLTDGFYYVDLHDYSTNMIVQSVGIDQKTNKHEFMNIDEVFIKDSQWEMVEKIHLRPWNKYDPEARHYFVKEDKIYNILNLIDLNILFFNEFIKFSDKTVSVNIDIFDKVAVRDVIQQAKKFEATFLIQYCNVKDERLYIPVVGDDYWFDVYIRYRRLKYSSYNSFNYNLINGL